MGEILHQQNDLSDQDLVVWSGAGQEEEDSNEEDQMEETRQMRELKLKVVEVNQMVIQVVVGIPAHQQIGLDGEYCSLKMRIHELGLKGMKSNPNQNHLYRIRDRPQGHQHYSRR